MGENLAPETYQGGVASVARLITGHEHQGMGENLAPETYLGGVASFHNWSLT